LSVPVPGLDTELCRSGEWLFRWRSYPPLIILVLVLSISAVDPTPVGGWDWAPLWSGLGLGFGGLGLGIRAWAIGYVPSGTSGRGTRAMRADTLNTRGMYSVVRHPLYLGNFLLWLGVATFAGKPSAILITCLCFWLYYERIMIAEERFLSARFGAEYARWAERTPAFFPRARSWVPSPHSFSLRFCLGRDYHAFYGFVVSTWIVGFVRSAAGYGLWMPDRAWWAYLASGTAVFGVLHVIRRRTDLLNPTDR
jgi:protein-S-isoprenylcysteine O-methyltransferase Ste14